MCRSISKHSNPNRKREIRDNFAQKAKHSDKHIDKDKAESTLSRTMQQNSRTRKRKNRNTLRHSSQLETQDTATDQNEIQQTRRMIERTKTNEAKTPEWHVCHTCATKRGYETKNGQEVFLWHKCNLWHKLPPQKHLALTGIQLQSRILNKQYNNKWKQTVT